MLSVSQKADNGLRKLEAENNMFMDERLKRECMSNVQVNIESDCSLTLR